MEDLVPAYVTAGVGVALLVIVALVTLRPVRRFTRASAALRGDVGQRIALLQALVNSRRSGRE